MSEIDMNYCGNFSMSSIVHDPYITLSHAINNQMMRDILDKEQKEYKEYMAAVDPVNHPSHYTSGKYEVIDIIEDQLSPEEFRGFLKGNIIKYICRAEHKNGLQDYQKAEFYSNKLAGRR